MNFKHLGQSIARVALLQYMEKRKGKWVLDGTRIRSGTTVGYCPVRLSGFAVSNTDAAIKWPEAAWAADLAPDSDPIGCIKLDILSFREAMLYAAGLV